MDPVAANCEKNHIPRAYFAVLALTGRRRVRRQQSKESVMTARFGRFWIVASWLELGLALGLVLALLAARPASAEPGTAEQRRACTPDVYRLCAGEIPNVRAITACLRRQRASLSDACRAVFQQ